MFNISNTDFPVRRPHICIGKIQNPTPRRKIEFLTDCCFNFQFNLRNNEYINSQDPNVKRKTRAAVGVRWGGGGGMVGQP